MNSVFSEQNLDRLSLGKLHGKPSLVWFSMLLLLHQEMRYEAHIRSRADLSETGKDQVLTAFLDVVRSISTRSPSKIWPSFSEGP